MASLFMSACTGIECATLRVLHESDLTDSTRDSSAETTPCQLDHPVQRLIQSSCSTVA